MAWSQDVLQDVLSGREVSQHFLDLVGSLSDETLYQWVDGRLSRSKTVVSWSNGQLDRVARGRVKFDDGECGNEVCGAYRHFSSVLSLARKQEQLSLARKQLVSNKNKTKFWITHHGVSLSPRLPQSRTTIDTILP